MTLPLSLDLDGLAGAFEAAATVAILIVLDGGDSTVLGKEKAVQAHGE